MLLGLHPGVKFAKQNHVKENDLGPSSLYSAMFLPAYLFSGIYFSRVHFLLSVVKLAHWVHRFLRVSIVAYLFFRIYVAYLFSQELCAHVLNTLCRNEEPVSRSCIESPTRKLCEGEKERKRNGDGGRRARMWVNIAMYGKHVLWELLISQVSTCGWCEKLEEMGGGRV